MKTSHLKPGTKVIHNGIEKTVEGAGESLAEYFTGRHLYYVRFGDDKTVYAFADDDWIPAFDNLAVVVIGNPRKVYIRRYPNAKLPWVNLGSGVCVTDDYIICLLDQGAQLI